MKLLIVLHHRFELWQPPKWFGERLHEEFPQIDVYQFADYEPATVHLPDSDIVVTWSLTPEQFKAAKRLKWIHSPAAAVHQLMIPEIIESDVVVTNSSSVHGPVVAEHVIALVLAMAKRLPSAVRYQDKHVWAQRELWAEFPKPREVAGATLGIVGLGHIGAEVAVRALALGMRVIGVREHPERPLPESMRRLNSDQLERVEVFGTGQLEEMLRRSDYVVLAAPLRDSTRTLMNAERLRAMKRDACLINVGRGALIDETALAEALRDKVIGGAGLDVFEKEPLPTDSPLWNARNVLITPHVAALTEKLWDRHFALLSENIRRFLRHERLLGIVDKRKGY